MLCGVVCVVCLCVWPVSLLTLEALGGKRHLRVNPIRGGGISKQNILYVCMYINIAINYLYAYIHVQIYIYI